METATWLFGWIFRYDVPLKPSFHYKWNRWKMFNFQKCFFVMETKTVTWIKGWLVGDRLIVHHSQSKSFAGIPNGKWVHITVMLWSVVSGFGHLFYRGNIYVMWRLFGSAVIILPKIAQMNPQTNSHQSSQIDFRCLYSMCLLQPVEINTRWPIRKFFICWHQTWSMDSALLLGLSQTFHHLIMVGGYGSLQPCYQHDQIKLAAAAAALSNNFDF